MRREAKKNLCKLFRIESEFPSSTPVSQWFHRSLRNSSELTHRESKIRISPMMYDAFSNWRAAI